MKKLFLLSVLITLVSFSESMAQVTLNCESGNRAIEQGNCWGFAQATYTGTPGVPITGSWSLQSGSLPGNSPDASWLKTPWVLVSSGNITFNARLGGLTGTTRGIELFYIPYDGNNPPAYEGTPVSFYSYNWPAPGIITPVMAFVVPVPGAIANSAAVYKIRVSFTGEGGLAPIISDDFVFPGLYWSDPANGCIPQAPVQDSDGDGVANTDDAYPNDPNKAYNSYFPSATQAGTLAFEDLWPAKGDYDFNDVVVDYKLQTVTNAANNVVEVNGAFTLRATGGCFNDGFGFQIDGITPDKICSVNGNSISHVTIYSIGPNGLETGQTYATCIVFDDSHRVLGLCQGNTEKGAAFSPYVTLNVRLVFINNGIPAPGGVVAGSQLTPAVFNFFIVGETLTGQVIGNVQPTFQDRGKEIHLAGRVPTSRANTALFGTRDDDTRPGEGKYYKTANNLPWGVNILQGFDYPIEKTPVNEAYLHFIEWAASSGTAYPDWYSNAPGYRDPSKIY